MRRRLEQGLRQGSARNGPVTDPLRVMVVDPEAASGSALGRAIDLDREMAVVGLSHNVRRAAVDAARCGPDLIAIRLPIEDERCRHLLAELAAAPGQLCVVVLGAAGEPDEAARDAAILAVRIRAVAEAAVSREATDASAVVLPPLLPMPRGRLN